MKKPSLPARTPKLSPSRFARLQWDVNLKERKTAPDHLATALRVAIYDGQFEDNEELNQVALAEFFGVSRVPIREALRQLQAEGLVQSIAHYRTVVVGLTLAQILEAIEMRAALEAHLLRKAGPNMRPDDIRKLRRICDESSRINDYGSKWVLKNWEFHKALYERSDSPGIIETAERTQMRIERYARRAGSKERSRQANAEHREICSAVERGEFEKASKLLERHILHTGDAIRLHFRDRAHSGDGTIATKTRKRRDGQTVTLPNPGN